MSSLAVRHRETNHFNYANPHEVYLADVGRGIEVAVMGLLPEHRFPLECTMGFVILSNGVPIGYGGSSVVFKQANTGVNIFDEYRGTEAAWLWVQVMRVFNTLAGCSRFIADAYQFGSGNTDALNSGAFWFYYRLGYRPVLTEIRALAGREFRKIKNTKGYRSSLPTLRKLATCDMHLTLPDARAGDLFDESWIEISSMLATHELSKEGSLSRKKAVKSLAQRVARDLGLRSLNTWSQSERRALERLGPIVAVADPASWPIEEKRSMARLIRAKGGKHEADYARRLNLHSWFFSALRNKCRSAV